MIRDKIQVPDPDRFKVVNKHRIEKAIVLSRENTRRAKNIHQTMLKHHTLKRMFSQKFRLSRDEVDRVVYETLRDHPEGLTMNQLQFFTGLARKTLDISCNRFLTKLISGHRGIFKRKIDTRTSIYYADQHSRKIAKCIKKTELEYAELQKQLEVMENGKKQ